MQSLISLTDKSKRNHGRLLSWIICSLALSALGAKFVTIAAFAQSLPKRQPNLQSLESGKASQVAQPGADRSANASITRDQFSWTPTWRVDRSRPGFPMLENVHHFVIQPPSPALGAYHHHPQLSLHQGRLFVSWSNHASGEDGPGQRVLYSHSQDGQSWSPATELFPAIDRLRTSEQLGRGLTALGFFQIDKQLFALAEAHQNTGFIEPHRSTSAAHQSSKRTSKYSKRSRLGLGRLVRLVHLDGSLGPIKWLNADKPTAVLGFPDYPTVDQTSQQTLKLKARLKSPLAMPAWDFKEGTAERVAADKTMLIEPFSWTTKSKQLIRMWRAESSIKRLYGQTSSDEGETWSPALPTPIPDAPSKSTAVQLDSGETLLIGNQVSNLRGTRRDPLTIAIADNGYHFDRAFAIRWRAPKPRVAAAQRSPDGRGRGFQYPSAKVDQESLWVVYSVNKESIELSRVHLKSLIQFSPCDSSDQACIDRVIRDSPKHFQHIQMSERIEMLGLSHQVLPSGALKLEIAWKLKPGHRPVRVIQLRDRERSLLLPGKHNSTLFQSTQTERRVLDRIIFSPSTVASAKTLAVGFWGPQEKFSLIQDKAGTPQRLLKVVDFK